MILSKNRRFFQNNLRKTIIFVTNNTFCYFCLRKSKIRQLNGAHTKISTKNPIFVPFISDFCSAYHSLNNIYLDIYLTHSFFHTYNSSNLMIIFTQHNNSINYSTNFSNKISLLVCHCVKLLHSIILMTR